MFQCSKPKAAEWHLFCPEHWTMLPARLQATLMEAQTYRRGSPEHLRLIVEAKDYLSV